MCANADLIDIQHMGMRSVWAAAVFGTPTSAEVGCPPGGYPVAPTSSVDGSGDGGLHHGPRHALELHESFATALAPGSLSVPFIWKHKPNGSLDNQQERRLAQKTDIIRAKDAKRWLQVAARRAPHGGMWVLAPS